MLICLAFTKSSKLAFENQKNRCSVKIDFFFFLNGTLLLQVPSQLHHLLEKALNKLYIVALLSYQQVTWLESFRQPKHIIKHWMKLSNYNFNRSSILLERKESSQISLSNNGRWPTSQYQPYGFKSPENVFNLTKLYCKSFQFHR